MIKKRYIFAAESGPIVQGIEQKFPKLQIQVRVLVGLQRKSLSAKSGRALPFSILRLV
jgi:hypothetical protein